MHMDEVTQVVRKGKKEADRGSLQGRGFAKSDSKSSGPTTGTGSSTCAGIRAVGRTAKRKRDQQLWPRLTHQLEK